jgi:hypothetical protein
MPNESVTSRQWYREIALALLLVCGALLLIGEVSARLPRVDALILIAGLAVFGILAARRLFRTSAASKLSSVAALSSSDAPAGGMRVAPADEINQALCVITLNADAIGSLIEKPQPDLGEVRAALADIVSAAERASQLVLGAAHPHHDAAHPPRQ